MGVPYNRIDDSIWTRVRFSGIATKFIKAFGAKNGLATLEKAFKAEAHAKENLSYFDFQGISDNLGVKEDDWMWEDFLSHLDDNNLACINLNDFVEWIKLYDIPVNIKCMKNIRELEDDKTRNTTPE